MDKVTLQFKTVSSQRGKKLLIRENYRYYKKRQNKNGHIVWHCASQKCNAILVTNYDCNLALKEQSHICNSSSVQNDLKEKIDECLERAKTESTPIPTIYKEQVEKLESTGLDLVLKLPNYNNLKKRMYKLRNKELQTKNVRFSKLRDVKVPGVHKDILLADYTEKKRRILLFATEEAKQILKKAKHISCDGTFKAADRPFKQLYTLHVDLGSTDTQTNIIPAVYALLPDKKRSTYVIFFNLIKSQIPEFNPESITTDFEISAMSAAKAVFENIATRGCIFHFKKAVQNKAKLLGITKQSNISRAHVRRCMALAYLPNTMISDGWLYVLGENIQNDDKTTQFNTYFQNTWIEKKSVLSNKWCFYNIRHKTNNAIEWWNSRLNRTLKSKPNIALLLNTLKKDAKYHFNLWRNQGYISKRTKESILKEQKINSSLRELIDQKISLGHCIEKLSY